MARIDSLGNFLTDVATAIKDKKGDTSPILASNFDVEITNLPSGGGGAPTPEKGFVIDEWGANGEATGITIIGMTTIPVYAFRSSSSPTTTNFLVRSLKRVNFPENLSNIDSYAFEYCKDLILEELPESLKKIGSYAFSNSSSNRAENINLKTLPSNLTLIEDRAFQYCNNSNLTRIDMTNSGGSIGPYAFYSNKIKNLSLVANKTGYYMYLNNYSFGYNKELEEVTLDGQISIQSSANYLFAYCDKLKKVTYKTALTSWIPAYGFMNCALLDTIVIDTDRTVSLSNTRPFDGTPIASGTGYIYVRDELVDTYKAASNWSTYANQIKPLSELPM